MPPSAWLRPRTWRKLRRRIDNAASFWLTRVERRDIITSAARLGVPGRRLQEHFQALRMEGVRYRDIGNRIREDLKEMEMLAEETKPDPKGFRESLKNRPLHEVLGEMQDYYQKMQAAQAAQGRQEGQE